MSRSTAPSAATTSSAGTPCTGNLRPKASTSRTSTRCLPTCAPGQSRCWSSGTPTGSSAWPGKALLDLLAEVAAAGGRVESVQEPTLGQADFGSQITTFIAGLVNADKSLHLSEQVRASFDTIRANEALHGRPPFGYATAGTTKYAKTLVPTGDGRTYMPEVFSRVIAGEPLRAIAAWLDGKGVKPPQGGQWWARSLSQLIRNPAYKGQRCAQDQKTKRYGTILSRHEALVDAATWRRANDALASRQPGRAGGKGHVSADPAMLSGGVLYCLHCGSTMYRIMCGGKRSYRIGYYRCFGTGPQRKGCGNSVRCDRADAAMQKIANSTFHAPVMVTRIKPGHSYEAELEEIRDELVNLARLGLPWARRTRSAPRCAPAMRS